MFEFFCVDVSSYFSKTISKHQLNSYKKFGSRQFVSLTATKLETVKCNVRRQETTTKAHTMINQQYRQHITKQAFLT